MRIGVDLDNTIVCYDALFYRLACEHRAIPVGIAPTKQGVRDYLRQRGEEPLWTELQGIAYGARMREATPFPGVLAFFQQCRAAEREVFVISHRTRFPVIGDRVDLHEAARQWLTQQGVLRTSAADCDPRRVFLELTREEKLRRISAVRCQVFVDDLPELLTDVDFPQEAARILFDPQGHHSVHPAYHRAGSWTEIADLLGRLA